MSSRTLENSIVRLLKQRPFYGYLLAGLRKGGGSATHPVGITFSGGIPTLHSAEELLAAYPPQQQEALLEHCLLHLLHRLRSGNKPSHSEYAHFSPIP